LNVDGAAFDAGRLLAAEAALSFHLGVLSRISQCYFGEVLDPLLRCLFRHLHALAGLLDGLFLRIDLALVIPEGAPFFTVVHFLAKDQFREVYQVCVKFRAVDADELRLAAYGGAAAAAHTGTVDHDRIEADDGIDPRRTGHVADGFHHDNRADAHDKSNLVGAALFDYLFQDIGDKTVMSVSAVIGGDIKGGARLLHFFFEDEHSLGAGADYGDDLVACLEKSLAMGRTGATPTAAAYADNGAELFNMTGLPSGRRHREVRCPARTSRASEWMCPLPEDDGDGALLAVIIRDCQGDTLSHVVAAYNDKLLGLTFLAISGT